MWIVNLQHMLKWLSWMGTSTGQADEDVRMNIMENWGREKQRREKSDTTEERKTGQVVDRMRATTVILFFSRPRPLPSSHLSPQPTLLPPSTSACPRLLPPSLTSTYIPFPTTALKTSLSPQPFPSLPQSPFPNPNASPILLIFPKLINSITSSTVFVLK